MTHTMDRQQARCPELPPRGKVAEQLGEDAVGDDEPCPRAQRTRDRGGGLVEGVGRVDRYGEIGRIDEDFPAHGLP